MLAAAQGPHAHVGQGREQGTGHGQQHGCLGQAAMGQVHRRQACLETVWLKALWLECSQRETRGMGLPEMERVGQQPHPQPAQHDRQQDLR